MNAAIPHVTPGAPPGPPDAPAADESVYAGFWIRFAAWLIDAVISIPVCLLAVWAACRIFIGPEAFSPLFEDGPDPAESLLFSLAFCAALLSATAYGALFTASMMQATPGKFILRMKVVDGLGNRLSLPRALGRDLAKFAAGAALLFIPYVIIGRTARKRAAHDMAAGTYVVARRAGALAPPETRFVVNAVFAKTFDVFWPNFWRFCTVTGIGFIVPFILITVSVFWGMSGSGVGLFFGILVLILSYFVFNSIAGGGLMWGAHAAINGNAPKIGEMLTHGVRRVRQVFTVNITVSLAVAAAMLAAVTPGIVLFMLFVTGVFGEPNPVFIVVFVFLIAVPMYGAMAVVMTVFAVALTAAALEDISAAVSLKRSLYLTKGLRWRVLGALFIALMFISLLGIALQSVERFVAAVFAPQAISVDLETVVMNMGGGAPVLFIVFVLVSFAALACVTTVFFGAFLTALYHELCAIKETEEKRGLL